MIAKQYRKRSSGGHGERVGGNNRADIEPTRKKVAEEEEESTGKYSGGGLGIGHHQ